MIGIGKFPRKGCRLEDREMDGYAMLYRAYLARRDLPGPEPTFADFVTIRKMQERIDAVVVEWARRVPFDQIPCVLAFLSARLLA